MSERFSQLDVDRINMRQRVKKRADVAQEAFEGKESELHRLILDECARRRFYVVHSRCDRATTQQKGVVDFIIAMPERLIYSGGGSDTVLPSTLWIEVKTGKNKLSAEQNVTKHVLTALGHRWHLVRSFEQFLEVIK